MAWVYGLGTWASTSVQGGVYSPADNAVLRAGTAAQNPNSRLRKYYRDAKNESPNMENNISEPAPPSARSPSLAGVRTTDHGIAPNSNFQPAKTAP
jgi:hypothetical protein